jgi:hypothetical protein
MTTTVMARRREGFDWLDDDVDNQCQSSNPRHHYY